MTTTISTVAEISSTPGLVLLTAGTPNGHKPNIALEELKAIGAIPGYAWKSISFPNSEMKEPYFLKINPNGRIPALVDNREGKKPINVWESASILLYLARVYDTKFAFHFADEDEEQDMTNWIFFIQGGLGPMQGQANHFFRYAPEKIQYGIDRYQNETRRLYSTYEKHLVDGNREWLCGSGAGKYSYADICTFPWVKIHNWSGVSLDEFPALAAWLARIEARPAVKLGLNVPTKIIEDDMSPAAVEKRAKEASAWGLANEKAAMEKKK